MKRILLFCFMIQLCIIKSFAQADCSSATIVCGNTQAFNPSGIGLVQEQLGCTGSDVEHNSQWVAFQAQASGPLNFILRPYNIAGLPAVVDFDWSFFQLPGSPSVSNCNNKVLLSCNYASPGSPFGVPGGTGMASPNLTALQLNQSVNVTAGTWYAIQIDQFANTTPQVVSIQFTGNPESNYMNSGAGIFANEPNFTYAPAGCGGVFNFTNTTVSIPGIASYFWDFGDGTTSTSINPNKTFLQFGTYYVTLRVTDNNGCQSFIKKGVTYQISNPVLTAVNIFPTSACTNSNNGTITIPYNGDGNTTNGVSGGTAPYTYELVNPSPNVRPSQVSNVFTGLQPGVYTIKVTDACNKSAITTITVGQVTTNGGITFAGSLFQASCANTPTGSLILTATGTVPPYIIESTGLTPAGPFTAIQQSSASAVFVQTLTNLAAGSQLFKVTDGCGKIQYVTTTVAVSQAPTVTIDRISSCRNTPTGSITVSAFAGTPGSSGNGSTGSFQYALLDGSAIVRPYQSSAFFGALLPGIYNVGVRDACGNENIASTSIFTATVPTLGTNFTTPSCPNGATGTIEVTVTQTNTGGGPVIYELIAPSIQLRPAQNSNTFSNLPPGTYTIRVTNNCGLISTNTSTIAAAAAPTLTTVFTTSCATPANGSITVTPGAASIAPYTFSLIAPSAETRPAQSSNIANSFNSVFKNLPAGNYTVNMVDGCNTPVTGTVTLGQTIALAATGNALLPSCASSATGQLTVTAPSLSSFPFTYEIVAPSTVTVPAQASNIFNGLPVGSYTVRITDQCGGVVNNTVSNIVATAAPSLIVTNTGSCAASSTGTITARANALGGGGPFQFSLIAPSPVIVPNQTSPIFTGLPNGAYTVQITDACGNTATATTTLANALPAPTVSATLTGCTGTNYAYRVFIGPTSFTPGGPVTGGGGPYTYALYDAANTTLVQGPQSTPIFNNVPAGVAYTARLTDACGTTATATLTAASVTPAALAAGTNSIVQSSCLSTPTGIIGLTAMSGGFAPYTYTLIDPAGPTVIQGPQTDRVFTGVPALASGYQVRCTDACGNIVNTTTLAFPAVAAPTVTVATTASCVTPATGTVIGTVVATGGGGTYSYTLLDAAGVVVIAGPQANPLFSGLAPATYTLRLTDACGVNSVAVGNAVVSPTPGAITNGTPTNTSSCTGSSTGTVTAAATSGGIPPYTYSLVETAGNTVVQGPQARNDFNNVPVGTYLIRVIDACGTISNSVNTTIIANVTPPTLTTSVASRCGDVNTLSGFGAAGAGAPYTYAICTGAACTTYGTYTATNQFTVGAGTYRVSVRDRCGNTTNSTDIVIAPVPTPSITAVTLSNTCAAADITGETVNANGAPGTIQYSLNNGTFSNTRPTAIAAGCNSLKIRYLNGSTASCESAEFRFVVFPNASILVLQASNCSDGTGTVDYEIVLGAAAPANFAYEYSLNGVTYQNSPIFTGIALGSSQTAYVRARFTGTLCTIGSTGCVKTEAFTVPAACATVLPVNGLTVSGKVTGASNTIYWTTSTEVNNRQFKVLASNDGVNFNVIGVVNTYAINGNSNTLINYSFVHTTPINGRSYYKVEVIDQVGNSKMSAIVTLKRSTGRIEITDVRPNPTTSVVYFSVIGAANNVVVTVRDMSGKEVIRTSIIQTNAFSVNLGKLANGMYILEATDTKTKEKAVFKINKQ